MKQPETAIARKLVRLIEGDGGWAFKVHGSPFQLAGIPDVVGCYRGLFFGIEVKVPGKKPSKIQNYRLRCIREAGGIGFWGDDASVMFEELKTQTQIGCPRTTE